MQPIHKAGSIALLAIVIGACSSTSVTSTWKSPAIGATRLHKVLVVAYVPTESVRRNLEDRLVRELGKEGVPASASHLYIEEADSLDKDRVRSVVQDNGFDSVLIADYLGTTHEVSYVPGTYYDYFTYWGSPYHGGMVDEWTEVKLEFRLFDAKGGRMVWTATTSTYDPSSASKEVPKVADKIVARLEKDIGR